MYCSRFFFLKGTLNIKIVYAIFSLTGSSPTDLVKHMKIAIQETYHK